MFVVAPPGAGKSTWVANKPGWHDQDMLYHKYHDESWHGATHTKLEEREHYQTIDRLVKRDRKTHNIIGCLFWDAVPDAVVMPPVGVHKERVARRGDLSWNKVAGIRKLILGVAARNRVPIFKTFRALERSRLYHRDMGSDEWYKRVARPPNRQRRETTPMFSPNRGLR